MNEKVAETDPLTNTDKVADAVRQVRAQLAQDIEQAVKKALREESENKLKLIKDAVTFFFSQALKK